MEKQIQIVKIFSIRPIYRKMLTPPRPAPKEPARGPARETGPSSAWLPRIFRQSLKGGNFIPFAFEKQVIPGQKKYSTHAQFLRRKTTLARLSAR
jgi:hypothetical protein